MSKIESLGKGRKILRAEENENTKDLSLWEYTCDGWVMDHYFYGYLDFLLEQIYMLMWIEKGKGV